MKKKIMFMFAWAVALIIIGALLQAFGVGGEFVGFGSVGMWMVYVGIVSLGIAAAKLVVRPKRVVDERMMYVASKANRVVFLALVIIAFAVMVVDGIKPITVPYHLFMSYLVCGLLVVYFVAYRVMLKYG